jgi:hypothetical protein
MVLKVSRVASALLSRTTLQSTKFEPAYIPELVCAVSASSFIDLYMDSALPASFLCWTPACNSRCQNCTGH